MIAVSATVGGFIVLVGLAVAVDYWLNSRKIRVNDELSIMRERREAHGEFLRRQENAQ